MEKRFYGIAVVPIVEKEDRMSQTQDTIVAALMEQLIAEGPEEWHRCSRRCSISPCAWSGSVSSGPGCTNANLDRRGYANGHKSKTLDTTAGTVTVDIPKAAGIDEPFYPQSLERGRPRSVTGQAAAG